MVKALRKAINGHGKMVGGLSAAALLTVLVGFLIQERYATIGHAADRVPMIDAWIGDHAKWTETTLNGVLQRISDGASASETMGERLSARIDEKSESMERQMVVQNESLGEWKREKNSSDAEWRAEQRERNREMLNILRKLEERAAGP